MGSELTVQVEQPRTIAEIKQQVNLIQQVMREVMKEGEHYGTIPGTPKPSLYKAGAEKINLTFRLDPQYEITEKYEDTPEGRHYTVVSKCTIYSQSSGMRLGSGFGSCTTREKKYAYRGGQRKCPTCGKEAIIKGKAEYGGGFLCFAKKGGCGAKFTDTDETITSQVEGLVPNPDLADQYNTILKMSNKRALIAAVLNVTAASDIFTQDLEDMNPADIHVPNKGPENAKPVQATAPKPEVKKPAVSEPTYTKAKTPAPMADETRTPEQIVAVLPKSIKAFLNSIGVATPEAAYEVYKKCNGDLNLIKAYCDERLKAGATAE